MITREMEISTVHGNPPHQIRVQKYISTDRITFGDFEVKPGDCFDPPDIHPGCEFYYLLGGVATVLNPHSGMAYQVRQGEGFLLAPNTWHQVHNFTDQNVAIMGVIAPAIWSEDELGSEIEYLEEPRYYKVNLEVEGPWPKPGGPEPDTGMTVLKADHLRHLIHGRQYHVLVSLLASNQYLHAGFITLPTRAFSEPESHRGDEVVCAMDGPLMIKVLDQEVGGRSVSQVCYEVLEGQKCLIPESEGALAGWSDFPVPRYLKH